MQTIVIRTHADPHELDPITYPVDTLAEIVIAQRALREAGLTEADVYVGEGENAYRNGQKIFAGQPGGA